MAEYVGWGIWANELYHFNPNHDPKNGQFTNSKGVSSSYSLKDARKDSQYSLNEFSRYKKNEVSRYNRAVKADAANSTKETRAAVRDAQKGIQAYDKTIKSLIKDAEERGLVVESKEVRDIATLGRDTITKYKVLDNDRFSRLSRADFDGDTVKGSTSSNLLENAKKNGSFDMGFLEATQNDNYSDKEMISEYAKYLDDPDKYMRTH